jgi:hypothetical protein
MFVNQAVIKTLVTSLPSAFTCMYSNHPCTKLQVAANMRQLPLSQHATVLSGRPTDFNVKTLQTAKSQPFFYTSAQQSIAVTDIARHTPQMAHV